MIEPTDLRDLAVAAHALAVDGVDGMDGASLCRVALAARQLRELADHLEVHALGELDELGYTDRELGMPTSMWFGSRTGMEPAVGRSQIKVGRVLRSHLHETDAAWLHGTITREHVRVMVGAANPRIRDQIAAAENDLLDLADGRPFTLWRQGVNQVASHLDEDGPDPTDPASTTASWSRSGSFAELRARFAGADVEVLEQLIDTKIDELARRQTRDRTTTTDIPLLTRAQLRGHAIAELLLDGYSATASPERLRTGITLVLRTTDDNPDRWPHLTDATWTLTNPKGDHLILEHFGSLMCDPDVHPLLVDDDGNPLKLGLSARRATAKIRRAAIVRDGGCCVFPGCDRAATRFHHIHHWEHRGPTDLDNIAGLCPYHHGVTHRTGWHMHTTVDHWFWWSTPSGHTFWSQRHGQQRAGPAPPNVDTAVAA